MLPNLAALSPPVGGPPVPSLYEIVCSHLTTLIRNDAVDSKSYDALLSTLHRLDGGGPSVHSLYEIVRSHLATLIRNDAVDSKSYNALLSTLHRHDGGWSSLPILPANDNILHSRWFAHLYALQHRDSLMHNHAIPEMSPDAIDTTFDVDCVRNEFGGSVRYVRAAYALAQWLLYTAQASYSFIREDVRWPETPTRRFPFGSLAPKMPLTRVCRLHMDIAANHFWHALLMRDGYSWWAPGISISNDGVEIYGNRRRVRTRIKPVHA
jgi:hypothetical protein